MSHHFRFVFDGMTWDCTQDLTMCDGCAGAGEGGVEGVGKYGREHCVKQFCRQQQRRRRRQRQLELVLENAAKCGRVGIVVVVICQPWGWRAARQCNPGDTANVKWLFYIVQAGKEEYDEALARKWNEMQLKVVLSFCLVWATVYLPRSRLSTPA